MKIEIAEIKTFYLSDSIEPVERLIEVKEMLNDTLQFDGELMTVEEYFRLTWNIENNGVNYTKVNLDRIGFHLSKMPEQEGTHDKDILSRNDELEMTKGVRRVTRNGEKVYVPSRYILHTNLSKETSAELGLADNIEDIQS